MVRPKQGKGGWSDIQPELLEEILRKLPLLDYLKCRRVCRSWRHIVDEAVAAKGTCPPAQFPFLMLLPSSLQSATLLDITQKDTSYTIAAPRTWKGGVDEVYSVEGWMVFRKFYYHRNYDLILFFNPVSGQEFELPHLSLFPGKVFNEVYIIELVFSSAPNSSDFFVVACATLLPYERNNLRKQQLAFWKVADKSWTKIPTDEYGSTYFNKFVILDRKLYAMTSSVLDSVTIFNLRDPNIITSERLVMLNPNALQMESSFEFKDGVWYCTSPRSDVRMTRDGDELLLVFHLTEHVLGSGERKLTKGFRIVKLDMCGPRWIEVDDLGDRVLLIDDTRIQVISAKEINLPGELNGRNCVFISILKKNTFKRCLGFFSLKDKSFKPLSLYPSLKEDSLQYCLWFMPSPW